MYIFTSVSILDLESHSSDIRQTKKSNSMKRRIRKIVNFFAFNLLFFALYLNFIHKDKTIAEPVPVQTNAAATITGTVPVQDVEKYLDAKPAAAATQSDAVDSDDVNALKLSIN